MLVVNLKKGQRHDIYIGRSTQSKLHYGNPFHIGPDGTRNDVVDKYELWLRGCAYTELEQERRAWILGTLHVLSGKRLGCYCAPERCHGEVLIKLWRERQEVKHEEFIECSR